MQHSFLRPIHLITPLLLSFLGCAPEVAKPTPATPPISPVASAQPESVPAPVHDEQTPVTAAPSGTGMSSETSDSDSLPQSGPSAGDVQERAVSPQLLKPGVTSPPIPAQKLITPGTIASPLLASPLPGEFAFRTQKGFYLTAIDGGGRIADPILVTASTTAGPWEKFRIAITNPSTPYDKSIQTARSNFLTAVNGGGLTANVFHTDATQARDWERFRLLDLSSGNFAPSFYAIQTIKGFYLTAVGAGGKYADAVHTDAKQIQSWEQFRIVKCGDPGSGVEYGVLSADGEFLTAPHGGGRTSESILLGSAFGSEWRFKLIRQGDGTYALQTINGVSFVTALNGGGEVQKYLPPDCGLFSACIGGFSDVFHTDATQVRAWEKFRFTDQGNCTYSIQTTSGFFVGIYKDSGGRTLLTARRSGPISENEKFQLVVTGLASPVVIQ